ncbi:hypothetical protein A1O3_06622 [Capronia epimyces CBS 606.96]|uniref:Transcription elongation factor Eaf N-terminal domain-containing protein n=1 Tax=Capronia epimyces CBS 606.96 TaxID=1182542 RepID=W9XQI6_9EURO|nr:uncharacterized protein A1O3_06622 [Capronia epimyces CBS 606.96]EXJ82807.1 hypothetical protein A1O3_06622 [Capronia epimyces CBS 606.96]
MASPGLHPMRPSGWVDPRRPADYPIVLGSSLKPHGDGRSRESLVNIRYNWQPKSGFGPRESKLTKSGDKYHLLIPARGPEDDDDYQYTGAVHMSKSEKSEDQPSSLALAFDKSKSCFVLEAISTSLDMNLKNGAGHSFKDARNLPQLPTRHPQSTDSAPTMGDGSRSPAAEDEAPDASNPYDYRHFLAEARESLEKSALQPGNRTPLSGISTPVPAGSRFPATTPQFKPTPNTSKPTAQRKKKTEHSTRNPSRTTTPLMAPKSTAKRDALKPSSQPLSKARITDSDEDDDETVESSRPSTKLSSTANKQDSSNRRPNHPPGRGHTRNISANIGSSPHIIINDDDGGLEIDMGSPPPEDRPMRRGRVDPEMFRSHTGTPIGGITSNDRRRPLSLSRPAAGEHGRREDKDVTMKDIDASSSGPSDEDGDVEVFELGSPREKRLSLPHSGDVSRLDDEDDNDEAPSQDQRQDLRRQQHYEEPPTPPAPTSGTAHDDDDDDEDLLAAALEAALEEEEEQAAPAHGIGLGIGMGTQDDESEVSEEE